MMKLVLPEVRTHHGCHAGVPHAWVLREPLAKLRISRISVQIVSETHVCPNACKMTKRTVGASFRAREKGVEGFVGGP
jgi:hypothetical protein